MKSSFSEQGGKKQTATKNRIVTLVPKKDLKKNNSVIKL